MSYYANWSFTDGERLALEVASVRGWSDFIRWANSLPARFKVLRRLADTGTCAEPSHLYADITRAAKVRQPGPSAKAVANRLLGIGIVEGWFHVSEEPEDGELD
jgi:hypothetical protein